MQVTEPSTRPYYRLPLRSTKPAHRRNNRRDRGETGPPTFRLGTNNVLVPQLLGRSFQKARNFTASSHQNAWFNMWVFKKFLGVIPPDPHSGRGRPLPHPTPSAAFGRALGANASVLGPKPWSPSTFQPWLRPWTCGYFPRASLP